MLSRLVTLAAGLCLLSIVVVGCGTGGGGSSSGTAESSTAQGAMTNHAASDDEVRAEVSACLEMGGAEVTRERDEISAGYEEVAAMAKDDGIVRVYPLEDPSSARDTARQLEFELEEIRPKALVLVKPVNGSNALIGVVGQEQTQAKGTEFFPSQADVTLATKCAP